MSAADGYDERLNPEIHALIDAIVGNPDYAVVCATWPWPDGGWVASSVLLDPDYAAEQGLPTKAYPTVQQWPRWDTTDGFMGGVTVHDASLCQAIRALHTRLMQAEVGPR